jgi:hypothetical protein
MLDPFSRGAILALTALCAAGAAELAPTPARGFFDQAGPQGVPRSAVALAAETVAIVPVLRDPFAEPKPQNAALAPAATPTTALAPTLVDAPTTTNAPVRRGTIETLPSNLTSDTIPTLPGAPPEPAEPLVTGAGSARITAIVTGAHPFAMVESGGNHEIKGIGDRLGGIPIVAIDIDGIRLQNGGRVSVDPAARQ